MFLFLTVAICILHAHHAVCQEESDDFLLSSEIDVMPSEHPYLMTELPKLMATSVAGEIMHPSAGPGEIFPSSVTEMQESSSMMELLTTESISPTGDYSMPECHDRTGQCSTLGASVCSDFRDWSRYYCPKFCDECENMAMTPPTSGMPAQAIKETTTETPSGTTTEQPVAMTTSGEGCCRDQLGWEKCLDYRLESCQEPFKAWASVRCQAFCGMCKPCPIEPCVDTLPNCHEYGQESCTGAGYRKWAMQNCRKHCGLCTNYGYYYLLNNLTAPTSAPGLSTTAAGHATGSVTGSGTGSGTGPTVGPTYGPDTGSSGICHDKVIHCEEYGMEDCAKYSKFMSAYCPKYCGFCSDKGSIAVTQGPTTTGSGSAGVTGATGGPVIPADCGDKLSNCTSYHDNCCGIYEPWARAHCASHCGFCGVPPKRLCTDTIDYCDRLNEDMCTNDKYAPYRESHCAGYCKLCERQWKPPYCAEYLFKEFSGATQKPTPAAGLVGASTVNPCENTIDDCIHVPLEDCCGPYEPWARAHCARYCGYCGVAPDRICHDTISYCDRMNDDLCTNDVFRIFRATKCAGFCKICDTPWKPPSCTAHLFQQPPTTDNLPTNMVG